MTTLYRLMQRPPQGHPFRAAPSIMSPLHHSRRSQCLTFSVSAGRSALKELQQLQNKGKQAGSYVPYPETDITRPISIFRSHSLKDGSQFTFGELQVSIQDDRRLRPYTISPRLHVPSSIQKPPYVDTGEMPWGEDPEVHNPEGLEKMRAACKLAAEVLKMAGTLVKPGISTDLIDKKVHQMIIDNGAYPSPLTYDARTLKEGDVVNVDVTVYLNGYHGDTSSMFYAGKPSERARWLCEVNREALHEGIRQCGPGVPINAIGKAIHNLADRLKVSVCPDFVGHGVGQHFHAQPVVSPIRNRDRTLMVPNQTFTIEPIFIDGNPRHQMWRDGWTVVTRDGSLTAQHEHTVLITDDGYDILTVA